MQKSQNIFTREFQIQPLKAGNFTIVDFALCVGGTYSFSYFLSNIKKVLKALLLLSKSANKMLGRAEPEHYWFCLATGRRYSILFFLASATVSQSTTSDLIHNGTTRSTTTLVFLLNMHARLLFF